MDHDGGSYRPLSTHSRDLLSSEQGIAQPLNYNLLDSQNNLTHVNRVICAKDGAKVTGHVRGHERN